jgi:low temperature requirement protein LtrA
VTRLELLYDVVFVFAFLNVTTVAAEHLTGRALLEALLVLVLLWWCWIGFAAVGNIIRADQGVMPLVGFVVIAGVFVLALTTSVAFTDAAGGLRGPVVFACAYLLTWAVKVAVLWVSMHPRRRAHLRSLLLAAPTMAGGLLILAAATVPERLVDPAVAPDVRMGMWAAALIVEYSVGILLVRTGWRLRSVGHWAERHALIVMVALGESVIALGINLTLNRHQPVTWALLTATGCGVAVIAALWWLYFDRLALAVEQVVHGVRDQRRLPLARDIYTFGHLPLIIGVIAFALGLKRHLATVADPTGHPGDGLGLAVLYGGVALYLLALVAIEWRALRQVRTIPVLAAGLLVALLSVARHTTALIALVWLTGTCVLLVLADLATTGRSRRQVRALAARERDALEAEATAWRRHHL